MPKAKTYKKVYRKSVTGQIFSGIGDEIVPKKPEEIDWDTPEGMAAKLEMDLDTVNQKEEEVLRSSLSDEHKDQICAELEKIREAIRLDFDRKVLEKEEENKSLTEQWLAGALKSIEGKLEDIEQAKATKMQAASADFSGVVNVMEWQARELQAERDAIEVQLGEKIEMMEEQCKVFRWSTGPKKRAPID